MNLSRGSEYIYMKKKQFYICRLQHDKGWSLKKQQPEDVFSRNLSLLNYFHKQQQNNLPLDARVAPQTENKKSAFQVQVTLS